MADHAPYLNLDSLWSIHAAAGAREKVAQVRVFAHLHQAAAVHDALNSAINNDQWDVINMDQVVAAMDMDSALAKMAGALADIGRDGVGPDHLLAAAKILEQAAHELKQQQILGTEDEIESLADPSLQVAQGVQKGHVDRVKLDDAANRVQFARGRRVRLDPGHAPVYVNSNRDIEELSPTEEHPPGVLYQVVINPPDEVQPYDADWAVRTEVVVTGVAPISCARLFADRLDWSALTRGWKVQGQEKLEQIADLLDRLDSLYTSAKNVLNRIVLPDNGVATPAFQELLRTLETRADEFNTFIYEPNTRELLMGTGEIASIGCAADLVWEIIYAAREVPLNADFVRRKAGDALHTINRIKDFHLVFRDRVEGEVKVEDEEEEPWEEAPW